ncbi:MAG TPA: M20/M25/M40 family metallo-hydrolase, partial [Streptosporangiaceae bacterium]
VRHMRDAVRAVRALPAAAQPAAAAGPRRRSAEPQLQVAGWLGDTASFGAKVPTVIFGPGGEPVYCPDEHLSVADIIEATQVYAAFAALALYQPDSQPDGPGAQD